MVTQMLHDQAISTMQPSLHCCVQYQNTTEQHYLTCAELGNPALQTLVLHQPPVVQHDRVREHQRVQCGGVHVRLQGEPQDRGDHPLHRGEL